MNIDYSRSAYAKKDDEEENWWQRRSGLERKLIILSVIAVLFAIGCLLYLILDHSQPPEICTTPICLSSASELASYMDTDADPCEDFYQFVCGKFSNGEGATIRGKIQQELENNMQKHLEELIQEPISDDDYCLARYQKEVLRACMNDTGSEQSIDIFHDTFLDEIGGWPVVKNFHWKARLFDWTDTMYLLRKNGYPYSMLLDVGVTFSVDDPNENAVYISDPFVNVIPEEHLHAYKNYMIDVAIAFGADRHRAEIEMPEVLEFMENLERIKVKNYDNTSGLINRTKTAVKDYQDRHDEIDWLEFINNILDPRATISNDDYVIFPTDEYIEAFFSLMDNTLKRIQAHYMIWRVLEQVIPYMNDELKRLRDDYICQTKKSSQLEDRKKFCMSAIDKSPFRIVYAGKYLTTEGGEQVQELFQYIKSEFTTTLAEASWIDEESAEKATQKAETIVEIIGALQGFPNDTAIDEIGKVEDSEEENYKNTFFGMALKRFRQDTDHLYSMLFLPDNYTIFNDWVSNTDVTYLSKSNVVVLPVGFIQKSYYDQDRPMYLNYAAMGTAIGSELGWGFLNRDDNLWSEESEKALEIQKECISKDLAELDLKPGEHMFSDAPSIEQSIADHAGVKVAYRAYQSWVKDNNEEAQLIGMEYTPYQLFWISAMSFNCYEITEDSSIHNNSSIFLSLLANGPFCNNPDFGNDFNCAADTAMNPLEKCEIF